MILSEKKEAVKCYHCGELCSSETHVLDDKKFCCLGCKTVYEILNKNQMCEFYAISEKPGMNQKKALKEDFSYLDDEEVVRKLIDFKNNSLTIVTFEIPQMHCSSCIWLLENLYKLNEGIIYSSVNFLRKELTVKFLHGKISFRETVETISSLGYTPKLNYGNTENKKEAKNSKKIILKIGVAGFCFGNIMLLSFPEYFSISVNDALFRQIFSYLNLILSLPVVFYSGAGYFTSAWKGLKKKFVTIDVPLALGIAVLFLRSVYEISTHTGAGYFDSLTGLVLFLLIGKFFQEKTYETLSFDRSYKAFFPLAVTVKENGNEATIPIANLKVGDRIIIRNNEIIPADSILFAGNGNIDYSFVTGESKPVEKVLGEIIYAGGRQTGSVIELEVIKEVSQSYLTQLWNNEAFGKEKETGFTSFSNRVSKYFTYIIISIALTGGLIWLPAGLNAALNVFTAVLIVACPCALALSTPFVLGSTLRVFGRNKFYLKNAHVAEELCKVDEIVFDKTGTITEAGNADVAFSGKKLSLFQINLIASTVRNSTHPLSRIIFNSLCAENIFFPEDYREYSNLGIEAKILGNTVKAGSFKFIKGTEEITPLESRVYISVNDVMLGYFRVTNKYRDGLDKTVNRLYRNYDISVLSGDNESEKPHLLSFFRSEKKILFRQTPSDKLDYIKKLQLEGKKVMMIGDGLNDAGALRQSNIGIAVTEDVTGFSPACDAILDSSMFFKISKFISFSKTAHKIIYINFAISIIYNLIGLYFGVTGALTPLIAAVLMPLSSITVVSFATFSIRILAKRKGL